MNAYIPYFIIFALLLALELLYFRIADRCNIIDKPNERSSHSKVVLRGGGVIFTLGLWIWAAFASAGLLGTGSGFQYPWVLVAVTMAAGISFVDDVHSLPDSVRLVVQLVAMLLLFVELGIMQWPMWWVVLIALFVSVGATNIINFMDGINCITGGYSLAVIVPVMIVNAQAALGCGGFCASGTEIIDHTFLNVVALSLIVFSLFNFRPKNKAKCFAGDVGSVGIAFILLFAIGMLIAWTGDVTYLTFLLVYGVDGCLTIIHRIMLHEHLGEAHRKHMYQLMSNELGMSHPVVSLIYMGVQLAVSLGFVFICPLASEALGIGLVACHWIYLAAALVILALVYLLFMKKYYHLHEEYLASLKK